MVVLYFTAKPCEPKIAFRYTKANFCKICPCTNSILCAIAEGLKTLVCIFIGDFSVSLGCHTHTTMHSFFMVSMASRMAHRRVSSNGKVAQDDAHQTNNNSQL